MGTEVAGKETGREAEGKEMWKERGQEGRRGVWRVGGKWGGMGMGREGGWE